MIKLTPRVKSVKVRTTKMALLGRVLTSVTNKDTTDHELVTQEGTIVGYMYEESSPSLPQLIDFFETQPILTSVRTKQFEQHVYSVGKLFVRVQIFLGSPIQYVVQLDGNAK